MNFRRHTKPETYGFQIAPMVDILLVLMVFFIMTWNFALKENALDVKVPSASHAKPANAYVGQVVVNLEADGRIVLNHKTITPNQLQTKLTELSHLYPDQAVIFRGDERVDYQRVVQVLDIFKAANIWNIAFATAKKQS